VLFTDGLTEARRGAEFLGHDAVAHLAQDAVARHGDAFDGVARTVFAAARAFAGGSLHDDACLLAARLDKTASR
jgi:serine phosphatase RsbU (regulator of sigma subunit)